MFRYLFFILTNLIFVSSEIPCFDMNVVKESNSLFVYENKVYDSKNFVHPGGQKYIKYIIGHDVEDLLKVDGLDFHLEKDWGKVESFLNSMYLGDITTSECITTTTTLPTTTLPSTTLPSTTLPTTYQPITCNISEWKDVKLDCGNCAVLANNMWFNYKTCDKYCKEQGFICINAYDDLNDQCEFSRILQCDEDVGLTSDAICQCGNETQTSTQPPTQTSTQQPTQTSIQQPTQTSTQPTQTSTRPTQTSTRPSTTNENNSEIITNYMNGVYWAILFILLATCLFLLNMLVSKNMCCSKQETKKVIKKKIDKPKSYDDNLVEELEEILKTVKDKDNVDDECKNV